MNISRVSSTILLSSLLVLLMGLAMPCTVLADQKPIPISFHKDILPIFRSACVGCHGMNSPAGGLSLASYASLIKGGKGGSPLTIGKGADSRLVKLLLGTMQPKMPPGGSLKQIDIDRIKQWIDAGAKTDAAIPESGLSKSKLGSKPGEPIVPAVAHHTAVGSFVLVPTPVTSLAFSADGKTLAVGSYQQVQFWDTASQKLLQTWNGHTDAVRSLSFSKDGKWLAAGGGLPTISGEIRLWDVAAGHESQVVEAHPDVVNAVAFSPDGKLIVSGSGDKSIKVWQLPSGKLSATLRDHSDGVLSAVFSPDGKYLASSGMDKSMKVWDISTGKRIYSITAHDDIVTDTEFSLDGKKLISSSADKSVKIWSFGTDSSNQLKALTGHKAGILAATFSPDGQTAATASADKSVKIWNVSSGGNSLSFSDAKDWVYTIKYSPDGKLLAAGTWDGQVLLWNTANAKLMGKLSTLRSHALTVSQ